MTQARGRIMHRGFDTEFEDGQIPWLETDPRRAPLRNDLVTALQAGLSPVVFWYILFTGSYDLRTAADATVIAMLITFGVSFVVTWARMASARRRRATLRSPRSKASLALVVSVILGYATITTSAAAYPDKPVEILLGLCAGLSAGVILLALERYAVTVPATES